MNQINIFLGNCGDNREPEQKQATLKRGDTASESQDKKGVTTAEPEPKPSQGEFALTGKTPLDLASLASFVAQEKRQRFEYEETANAMLSRLDSTIKSLKAENEAQQTLIMRLTTENETRREEIRVLRERLATVPRFKPVKLINQETGANHFPVGPVQN